MSDMAIAQEAATSTKESSRRSLLRQRFWRWHFFAGLFVIPFVVLLATTGSIYVLKPQIDALEERQIHNSAASGLDETALGADALLAILLEKDPGATLSQFTLAKADDRSVEIELLHSQVDQPGQWVPVTYWVDQYSGEVLAQKYSDKRFLQVVKKIHSELLLGSNGSYVVELMASWTIILLITGVYLWVSSSGITASRLLRVDWSNLPKKLRWRNLHGVIGLWIALPLFLILMTGLTWTQLWGANFKTVSAAMGWDGPGQEWFITLQSKLPEGFSESDFSSGLWEIDSSTGHHSSAGGNTSSAEMNHGNLMGLPEQVPISVIAAKPEVMSLIPPVNIMPPKPSNGVWTVRSMPQDRSQRVTLHFDQYTGEQIMRIGFEDHHAVERFVSSGVSFHEGALFGWLNQVLVLLTAFFTIALSVLGAVIWWRRRPKGELGAPVRVQRPLSVGLIFGIVVLGVFLPAAGISILLIVVLEFVWFRVGIGRSLLDR